MVCEHKRTDVFNWGMSEGSGGGGGGRGGWWVKGGSGRGGAPYYGRDERCGSSRPLPGGSWEYEECTHATPLPRC